MRQESPSVPEGEDVNRVDWFSGPLAGSRIGGNGLGWAAGIVTSGLLYAVLPGSRPRGSGPAAGGPAADREREPAGSLSN